MFSIGLTVPSWSRARKRRGNARPAKLTLHAVSTFLEPLVAISDGVAAGLRIFQPAKFHELLSPTQRHRNEAISSSTITETFNFMSSNGCMSRSLRLGQWTPAEELSVGIRGPASLENSSFRNFVHELLTRDGFAILKPETISPLAGEWGGGLQRMVQLIFQDVRASIVPVMLAWGSTCYARDGSTKVTEFHVDELPTTVKSRNRLLVNIWLPHSMPLHSQFRRTVRPDSNRGSSAASEQFAASEVEALQEAQEALVPGAAAERKRLAIVRGSAFADVAKAELQKINGPGLLEGRAMIRVHECLSHEAAVLLAESGDIGASPPDTCVIFISGTSSQTERVPICPHAGALQGASDEHRFYVYPAQ